MSTRVANAAKIVRKYTLWSGGAGFVPVAVLDLAAVTAVQMKMLAELAEHYEIPFDLAQAKPVVAGLLSSATAYGLFHGFPGTLVRSVPLLNVIGALTKPFMAGLVTYGLGNVFITHFEAGGTIATLDPDDPAVQRAYREGQRGRARAATASARGRGASAAR